MSGGGVWLPNTTHIDLSVKGKGNGPFALGRFRGVIPHVNVGDTPDSWFVNGGGAGSVCPNFQVHTNGAATQFLPLNWQPWCQSAGNSAYAAIECAGDVGYPLNPAQLATIAIILRAYVNTMGLRLQLANTPGAYGIGTHAMGGAAWGGHTCPGPIRTAQRQTMLDLVSGRATPRPSIPTPAPEDDMTPEQATLLGQIGWGVLDPAQGLRRVAADHTIQIAALQHSGLSLGLDINQTEPGDKKVWVGNGITRRWIPNPESLKNIQWLIDTGVFPGDSKVYPRGDIGALGVAIP